MKPSAEVSVPSSPELFEDGTGSCDLHAVYDNWLCGDPSNDSDEMLSSVPLPSVPSSLGPLDPSETSLSPPPLHAPTGGEYAFPIVPSTESSSSATIFTVVPPKPHPPHSSQRNDDQPERPHPSSPRALTSPSVDHPPHRAADKQDKHLPPPSASCCRLDSEDRIPGCVTVHWSVATASANPNAPPRDTTPCRTYEHLVPPQLPRTFKQPLSRSVHATSCFESIPDLVDSSRAPPMRPCAVPHAYYPSSVAESECAYVRLHCVAEDVAQGRVHMARTLSVVERVIGCMDSKLSSRPQAHARLLAPGTFSPSASCSRIPGLRSRLRRGERYMSRWLPACCSSPDPTSSSSASSPRELDWSRYNLDPDLSEQFRRTASPKPMRLCETI